MTSALIRPRGETSKAFLSAQSRIAFNCSADRPDPVLLAVEVFARTLSAEWTFSVWGECSFDLVGVSGPKINSIIDPLIREGDLVP